MKKTFYSVFMALSRIYRCMPCLNPQIILIEGLNTIFLLCKWSVFVVKNRGNGLAFYKENG